MSWLKNRRNKKWSKKLGWTPQHFDESNFDRSLELAITYFQKLYPEHLETDGICGPATYRFLLNDLNRNGLLDEDEDIRKAQTWVNHSPIWGKVPDKNKHPTKVLQVLSDGSNPGGTCLLINGKWVDIDWPTVWMPLPSKNFKKVKNLRPITCSVIHHDATTSAEICFRALKNGGISSHLCIDNDGVIYQFADLNDICWHAGVSFWKKKGIRKRFSSRKLNKMSIGIDLSNGWYLKYNKTYVKKGFKPRKILENSRIHGMKMKPHLDMYPIQIVALKVLMKVLAVIYDIPLKVPTKNGKFVRGWVDKCMKGNFKGFQVHFNSSINKIDTDLELLKIVEEVKSEESYKLIEEHFKRIGAV